MSRSIYVINPKADFPTYWGAEMLQGWGFKGGSAIADLACVTVAGLVPDSFDVRVCDENISPIDWASQADFIAVTGKVSQWGRMRAIARRFRKLGKTVIIGGPYASLCPDIVAKECDIIFRGELEQVAPQLFSDLLASSWKDEYLGTVPSLDLGALPRWDLYPNDRALIGSVQTSRGCPFECEFCDVIQYLGRRQRHKSIPRVLAELDQVYRLGYRAVFLVDDNFTSSRKRCKELLVALAEWNERQDEKVWFLTQLSIDAARDDELLLLLAKAGLTYAFIGLETPNQESLRESKKRQNVGVDLVGQVQRFYDHGIMVSAGMIVGFDQDGPDIFDRQFEFLMAAAIPFASMGALVAPAATPLRARLESAGRLLPDGPEVAGFPWDTNIRPALMSHDELVSGVKQLVRRLYEPAAFGDRMVRFVARSGRRLDPMHRAFESQATRSIKSVEKDTGRVLRRLASLGPEESQMIYRILGAVSRKPETLDYVMTGLMGYAQVRFMMEQVDDGLASGGRSEATEPRLWAGLESRSRVAVLGATRLL